MANDADNIRVGTTGKILIAPKGTVAPVDLVSAWGVGWVDLGFLSDDGCEMQYSTSTDDIKAWQSLSPVRKVLTGVDLTVAFTCLELKKTVVELFFPSASISTTGGVSTLAIPSAPDPDERAIGWEWEDGDITNRLVIARSEITDRGSITTQRGSAAGLQMTASAYATSAEEIATWLSNDPSWAA